MKKRNRIISHLLLLIILFFIVFGLISLHKITMDRIRYENAVKRLMETHIEYVQIDIDTVEVTPIKRRYKVKKQDIAPIEIKGDTIDSVLLMILRLKNTGIIEDETTKFLSENGDLRYEFKDKDKIVFVDGDISPYISGHLMSSFNKTVKKQTFGPSVDVGLMIEKSSRIDIKYNWTPFDRDGTFYSDPNTYKIELKYSYSF